jgi:pimeloyl-ACP methyl ester carboxylesterase
LHTLDYKGGSIQYDVSGKGNAVVFLHGFLETLAVWDNYASSLSGRFKVVRIDLPGHGASSCYGYSHSMEFMAETVLAVLKELKIRKFHLVGHSMGGYVAIALAEIFPDMIRGLCMFHSTSNSDSAQKKKERNKVIRLVQKNKGISVRQAIPNLFNTAFKPYKKAIKDITGKAMKTSLQGIIASLEGMKIREDRQIVMKFAPYPILYIIGRYDNVLPMKKLLAEVDNSEYAESVILENAGHMGFIEDDYVCQTAIQKFLRKT